MVDSMETYRQLNQDLIQQIQEYKRKQRLFEMKDLHNMQETLLLKRVIREHKSLIESFVVQNTQDLGLLLNKMSEAGAGGGMSVVTEFVKRMSINLQNLLLHISTDENSLPAVQRRPPPALKRPGTAPSETQKVVSPETDEAKTGATGGGAGGVDGQQTSTTAEGSQPSTPSLDLPADCFITKRRRVNVFPRNYTDDEEQEQEKEREKTVAEPKPKVPECDPVTLPNGMLSTITEDSLDKHEISIPEAVDEEEEDGDDDGQEEVEQQKQVEEKREAVEADIKEKENVTQAGKISIIMDPEELPVSSTPNPRKRMIASRCVLSPVDNTSTDTARVKRSRTPMPRKRSEEVAEQPAVASASSRPRRKAAPQVLTEPKLSTKMRQ